MESEGDFRKCVPYSYQCPELKNEDTKRISSTISYNNWWENVHEQFWGGVGGLDKKALLLGDFLLTF